MTIHANSDIGHNHKTHNWEFADAAARTAHTYATGDVGKEALQLDDSTFWKIIAVASGVATFRETAPTATVQHFRGKYTSSGALTTAHPTALDGDYAIVDSGAGTNADEYIWDANEGWIKSTAASAGSTDTLTEGSANLYFTGARAIASVLTGFTAGSGTVSAADTILQAIQKIVGNVSGLSLFKTISVAGQSDVVADSQTDTLTLVAGTNVTITTDASTDTITIAASGGDTTTTEGALINSATAKTTPVDADMFGLMDSAASNILKKLSWSNTKATLKIYFDTLYTAVVIVATTGYAMGGNAGGVSSEIDGIIFATEAATNPAAVLSVAREQAAGTSSSTTGYAMGGGTAAAASSEIEGIIFATEAATNPAAVLAVAREFPTGTSSTTTGYAMGGNAGGVSSEIDGIIFATEAATNPAAVLSVSRMYMAGVSSSTTGYALGGYTAGAASSEIDGIIFATEAATNPAAVLAVARYGPTGIFSTTKGYAMGGNAGGVSSEIDGIIFATEAATNPAAVLSVSRMYMAGVSSSTTGYALGGYTGGINTYEIDGMLFATEAATNPAAVLAVARYSGAGVQG